jgi:hypothetical protein
MSDILIHEVIQELPQSSLTTKLLSSLDYVVPGEWENIRTFEGMIRSVTGEEDQTILQQVGERAIALFADPQQGYQRAVQIYRLIDDTGGIAGAFSLANKVGDSFDFLSFLGSVTPKADTTQAIDAGVKLVGELAAFCYCNGIPGDSIGDFAQSLLASGKEDAIRLTAFLACDCLIPLGPDFISKLMEQLSSLSSDAIGQHSRFAKIASYLPGGNIEEKRGLIARNIESTGASLQQFVGSKGMTRESVLDRIKQGLGLADNKLDYVAAGLDLTTSYFEHTGIQTVCRRLVSRAYGEI